MVIFSDIFSRYSIVRYLKTNKSSEVKEIFDSEWIQNFGKPNEFICDNGSHYISNEFSNFCKKKKIKIRYISPYNPTSNGLSERINQTVANVLRIEKGSLSLEEAITRIENNLNNTTYRTLGVLQMKLLSVVQRMLLLEEKYKFKRMRLDNV